MDLNVLTSFVSLVLAVSLAAERLVTSLKTLFPGLADEKKTPAQEVDLRADRPRSFGVQLLAFVASWATSAMLADSKQIGLASLVGTITIGPATAGLHVPVLIMGLLASGGSAFWNNLLGYTKAAKDTKQVEKASNTLPYHAQAEASGVVAVDSGMAATAGGRAKARDPKAVARIGELSQPAFGLEVSRLIRRKEDA